MKTIYVDFSKSVLKEIAKQGDHNQTQLVFTLPETFTGADYVNAEFVKRDRTTAVIEQLTPSDGTVTVPLTQELTDVDGRLEIQLVAYVVDGTEITEIAKSDVVRGVIRRALNVLHGQDELGVIERFLAFVNTWAPKLTELLAAKHTHTNKATLDGFHNPYLENPPGELAVNSIGFDRVTYGGNQLFLSGDGAVVDYIETVTVSGKSFLRLWLYYGDIVTIVSRPGDRPDFIDIPIDSATASTVTQGGLTVNGTEVDLGIDALEADAHTHANKSTLDDIGEVEMFVGGNIARFENHPFNDTPHYFYHIGASYTGYLYGGAIVRLTQLMTNAVTITGLSNPGNYQNPEYMIFFTTGATAPTLTLPASVEWVDELTVEANKFYQISILENVALWCAVDVEVEE